MQKALSDTLGDPDMRTIESRCSPRFRITGSHTSTTFELKAVRVGHEPVEDDFDWAFAMTDESGADDDGQHTAHNKALCYVPASAQDSTLTELLRKFEQFDQCDQERELQTMVAP